MEDVGTHNRDSVDYPDFAQAACRQVLSGDAERAILVCGSGVGMSMAANRFKGIRAVLCMDLYLARYSRLHNDCQRALPSRAPHGHRAWRRRSSRSGWRPPSRGEGIRSGWRRLDQVTLRICEFRISN